MTTPSPLRLANVSRRSLMKGMGAGLILSVSFSPGAMAKAVAPKYGADGERNGWRDNPKLFVLIYPNSDVRFFCTRQEMGQGIRTSLALALADELEADLARVTVVQADGDEAKWGNQDTDGSRSMRHFFLPMRLAGAAARLMLEQAAAQTWGVAVADVRADNNMLIHVPSGRRLSFGAVAAQAATLPVPPRQAIKLKSPAQFRYIGKDKVTGVDLFDITTGRAQYGIDVR